jgi:hypothetical protein
MSDQPSITPEMIVAGVQELRMAHTAPISDFYYAQRVYRAMHDASPVELVPEGERIALNQAYNAEGRVKELEKDKTELYTRAEAWKRSTLALERERDHWKSEADRLANGPPTQHPPEYVAKVLMDREGRHDDRMAHARLTEVIRCARLDGRKQARDEISALLAYQDKLVQWLADEAPKREALEDKISALEHRIAGDVLASEPGDHLYHGPVRDGASIPDPDHERFHQSVGDVLAGKILPKAREQMAEALKRTPPDAVTDASTSKPMPGRAMGAFGDPRRMGLV